MIAIGLVVIGFFTGFFFQFFAKLLYILSIATRFLSRPDIMIYSYYRKLESQLFVRVFKQAQHYHRISSARNTCENNSIF